MKTVCPTPETPEFYMSCICDDMQLTYEHSLDMLKKCKVKSDEWEFYHSILTAYSNYIDVANDKIKAQIQC